MNAVFDIETIRLLIVFVLPGLVSMQVYRLLMPAKEIPWADALLQAFFYSSINLAFLFPAIYFFLASDGLSIWWSWLLLLAFLFIGPIAWPALLVRFFRSEWVAKHIKIPYPTTWDYFFDDAGPVFLLIHLNNGDVIGGLWSASSHAGQFPHDGDLYLEALYQINEDGNLGEPVPFTRGLLVRKEEYTHIEIFDVPLIDEEIDGEG